MNQPTSMHMKSMGFRDEHRAFDHWKYDLVTIGSSTFERVIFEPGFRWST